MDYASDGIRCCYQYQNGNILLNNDYIAVNKSRRVLSVTKTFAKNQIYVKNVS